MGAWPSAECTVCVSQGLPPPGNGQGVQLAEEAQVLIPKRRLCVPCRYLVCPPAHGPAVVRRATRRCCRPGCPRPQRAWMLPPPLGLRWPTCRTDPILGGLVRATGEIQRLSGDRPPTLTRGQESSILRAPSACPPGPSVLSPRSPSTPSHLAHTRPLWSNWSTSLPPTSLASVVLPSWPPTL